MQMYSEADVDISVLGEQRIAVLGYGSQGRAHALNLKDSGCNVVVGLRRSGSSWAKAEADGLAVEEPDAAVRGAAVVMFLTPDMVQKTLYETVVDKIEQGALLLFAHGFAIHYGQVEPRADLDVALIAPKGPGGLVRRQYEEGHGVPCLVAVHQDATGNALSKALAYSAGIGGARAGVIETTFAEETETDLFGEQAVLCGGATELIVAGFETLVEAGYQPEVAYYEVMHELKLIVDLLHEGGLAKMHKFISDTAAWGDMVSGPRVVGDASRAAMREVLTEIRDGTFARNWITENENGMPEFRAKMRADLEHPIEDVGRRLRGRMDWLSE
ncbi:MAG: ketol-acid reductoisomerase [Gammaproteobacteria bacterium]|nr:ketol-acid reductoisomerase [Gammaproteobacteria bacterium]NNF48625.1 ketol-acid reductoisomerase [Woeseiaceae bacterium]MBT8094177.1 ketol-acid reductoisomerase [Gammaproteobacteria bacterium]MBT8105067.1 ketol-acid reductoisomerase [Gammaproteobacteria bacterium]NNK25081.1 ketol-acid reductoisomerase [Woeseiaceae bacterium]